MHIFRHLLRFPFRSHHNSFSQKLSSGPIWGSKSKKHRKIRIHFLDSIMDPKAEAVLAPLRASVKEQGDLVRSLKTSNAADAEVKRAVLELKARKKALEEKEISLSPGVQDFDRNKMEDLLKRRFFYDQSFAIYGGVSGQFDLGPMGCATKSNLLSAWKKNFVLEESMLEVDCTALTPESVLKASGHVDKFADLMVKDTVNGECFRLDHLIQSTLEALKNNKKTSGDTKAEIDTILSRLEGYGKEEMSSILQKFAIKSPITGNDLSEPMEFNLMFETHIGPTGLLKGFLRPETAQGIFVNFKRLLEFNQGRLPFAAAQIGNAYRNEISPRSGLLRVREFTMAEIEHFVDPADKSHSKFENVKDTKLNLFSACNQMDGKSSVAMSIGEAVSTKLVDNETLGYFMARIHIFLVQMGADPKRLRFRQHMSNEMAHYAVDCWDAELLTSYGWVECVGCADRSAYDLKAHSKATGVKLVAEKKLQAPIKESTLEIVPNKGAMGKAFKKESKGIVAALAQVEDVSAFEKTLEEKGAVKVTIEGGQEFELSKEYVSIKRGEVVRHVEEVIPSVVEPSFGVGRILYALFEHNFKVRKEDEQRSYLSLPPVIAPLKCSLLPLSNNTEFAPLIKELSAQLTRAEISHKVDDSSGSIGRRYARTDEIAIPFGICIDFDSLKDDPPTATLRERDSTLQVRMKMGEIPGVLKELSDGRISWGDVMDKYPKFEQQETKK